MKKLAIVTSYGELCGNAEYSTALKKGLEKYYQVSILPLNVDILRKMTRKDGKKSIKELAEKLKDFDLVNIQFEAGLLGISTNDIFCRFLALLKNSNKLIVTMHRLDMKEPVFTKENLRLLLKLRLRSFKRNTLKSIHMNRFANLYKKIINSVVKKKAAIIVHTVREKNRILLISDSKATVFDHPLSYLTREEVEHYRKNANKANFLNSLNLPSDAITIGAYGFISSYKGIDTLVRCLEFLPENFHILVFESQHPLNISSNPQGDPTLFEYIKMIHPQKTNFQQSKNSPGALPIPAINSNLLNRFHFLGGFLNHDDFIKTIIECDISVFPYHEVGQSGSGVVAVALDVGANIICSQNLSFLELVKYTGSALRIFSIGNYLELAEKIKIAAKNGLAFPEHMHQYNATYDLNAIAKMYAEIFESL